MSWLLWRTIDATAGNDLPMCNRPLLRVLLGNSHSRPFWRGFGAGYHRNGAFVSASAVVSSRSRRMGLATSSVSGKDHHSISYSCPPWATGLHSYSKWNLESTTAFKLCSAFTKKLLSLPVVWDFLCHRYWYRVLLQCHLRGLVVCEKCKRYSITN